MQGTNPTEFERWCAKEMGNTVEYIISCRKRLGMLSEYSDHEVNKRYRAWMASWRGRAKYFINGGQDAGN
nr:hypothetical protein [Providencia rettgeri]